MRLSPRRHPRRRLRCSRGHARRVRVEVDVAHVDGVVVAAAVHAALSRFLPVGEHLEQAGEVAIKLFSTLLDGGCEGKRLVLC